MSLLLDLCPKPLSTLAESSEASVEAELFVSEFLDTALLEGMTGRSPGCAECVHDSKAV